MSKYFLLVSIMVLLGCQTGDSPATEEATEATAEPTGKDNVAYQWGQMALTATANDTETFKPRPTITSRYLALIFVSVFDAWSRYDEKATPVYLSEVDRRPADEQTLSNKEIAISYAAYRAMNEYYYTDRELFASDDRLRATGRGS